MDNSIETTLIRWLSSLSRGSYLRRVSIRVEACIAKTGCPFELVLVDDGSPDEYVANHRDEARTFPNLRAIRLSRNLGKNWLCVPVWNARGQWGRVDGRRWTTSAIALGGDDTDLANVGADIVEAVKIRRGREPLSGKIGALLFYIILNSSRDLI